MYSNVQAIIGFGFILLFVFANRLHNALNSKFVRCDQTHFIFKTITIIKKTITFHRTYWHFYRICTVFFVSFVDNARNK